MLEHSVYSVISPEGCASILWRDSESASKAADSLKLTSQDLLELKVIDHIIDEPVGGAHSNIVETCNSLKKYLSEIFKTYTNKSRQEIISQREEKFLTIGKRFIEG